MKVYTVSQIAKMLSVDPETVRRWIRSKELPAEPNVGKKGKVVTEENLRKYLAKNRHAKYTRNAAKAIGTAGALGAVAELGTLTGASALAAAIVTGILTGPVKSLILNKGTKNEQVDLRYIDESVAKLKESIAGKRKKIEQLQKELDEEECLLRVLDDTSETETL